MFAGTGYVPTGNLPEDEDTESEVRDVGVVPPFNSNRFKFADVLPLGL